MTIEELVLEKLRELPPEKQKVVLEFVESPRERGGKQKPLGSLRGLWADFGIGITEEDIAEALREMWGNFPQDISGWRSSWNRMPHHGICWMRKIFRKLLPFD